MIQDWLKIFKESIVDKFQVFVIYTNNSAKFKDKNTLKKDLAEIVNQVKQLSGSENIDFFKQDVNCILDSEIDQNGNCRYDIMSFLNKKMPDFIQKKLIISGLACEEDGKNDFNFLSFLKTFDVYFNTHSSLAPEYLTKIKYQVIGSLQTFDCVLILDVKNQNFQI